MMICHCFESELYLPLAGRLRCSVEQFGRDIRCTANEGAGSGSFLESYCASLKHTHGHSHRSPSGARYADPKSDSFTRNSWSKRTFSGLRSRWSTPLLCIHNTASTIWAMYHLAHDKDSEPYFLTNSARSPFGARSKTKSRRWLMSIPTSCATRRHTQ